jgi:hypothetical protein
MIFRGLDPTTEDWTFGQGISSYVGGSAAVALNVKTALQTFLGDAFWAATFGVDWINLLGNRNTLNAILAQTRAVIAGAEGVTAILSVSSNLDRATRTLTLQYSYADVYSPNVSGSANVTI